MRKKVTGIIFAVTLVLVLSISAFATPIEGTVAFDEVNEEDIILISVTDPNQLQLLNNTVLLPPTFTLAAGKSKLIGLDGADGTSYFNTTPNSTCVFVFYSDVNQSYTVHYVTIGGVEYPVTCYQFSSSGGTYGYRCEWVHPTATPYRLKITNNGSATSTISGLVFSY